MIPIYQKKIIHRANQKAKLIITATQMLDSMIRNPLPTRAEVTDVANAIYDGSGAIMLSGETAAGRYPVEAVRRMRQIADRVEENLGLSRGLIRMEERGHAQDAEQVVARSVCNAASLLEAGCIVAHTISGQTARLISANRPLTPILAITPLQETYHQLSLVWGIETLLLPSFENEFLQTLRSADRMLKERGLVRDGELVVVSAGIPASTSGGTNLMKVHRVGSS